MAHKTARSDYIATPVIRGAYIFAHVKRSKDGDGKLIPEEKQRYEFTGLVPKLNADPMQCANYKIFSDLAMQAISRCTDFGGQFPAGGNWPIQDGDNPAKIAKYPWRAGCWIVKFSANFAPKVCLRTDFAGDIELPARSLTAPTNGMFTNPALRTLFERFGTNDLYKGGDFCIASTNAFTYDDRAKGVKFNFDGLLFVAPGEPIGTASRSVQQMFGGTAAAPAPAPSPAPQMQYAPPAAAPAPSYAAPPVAPPVPGAAAPAYAPPPIPGAAPAPAGLPPIPGR